VPDPPPIALADAIRALRAELQEAMRAGEGEQLRFALGPVELELHVQAESEGGVDGAIKFWLVSLGAKGSHASQVSHTVRLSLTAVRAGEVSGEDLDVLVRSDLEPRG
jgi:hypothetical protein